MPNTHTLTLTCDHCGHSHDSTDAIEVQVYPDIEQEQSIVELLCQDIPSCVARTFDTTRPLAWVAQ